MTLLVALLLAADPATSHQVSIPLADYEQLRKQTERPALTVIDLLRVEGSFAKRDLAVTFTGRASGSWPTAPVLAADGIRLHSCEGEALLSRADSGAFAVTPLAQKFTLRCRVALDGSDRLEAQATGSVLEVVSAVTDGELVASGGGPGRSFSVVRKIAGEQQDLPPTVTGRYLVTLLPDEARFAYQLEVHNPARGHRRFEVALRDAEHVEGVDAQVAWDAEGTRYRFDLPPGDTTLSLRGRLTEARFTPPVAASLQYLLLESHPLIRPDVRTAAKRVGVAETGLGARFRGAQAFLLGGGDGAQVAWTATRLEALKTAGLALHQLNQVFFLGADGVARAESGLTVDNQGAPALTLPGGGKPTFASVGGEPAFLTNDKDGNLFLPLAQGPQEVLVQSSQEFRHRLGLGWASLELPRPGVPASRATVQLRYPSDWIPVYEQLAPTSRWHFLDLGDLAALLFLVALAERLLALAGLSRSRRWLLAFTLALAAAFLPALRAAALWILVLAWLALGAALLVQRLHGAARVWVLAGGGVALFLILLVVAGSGALRLGASAPPDGWESPKVAYRSAPASPAPPSEKLARVDELVAGQAAAGGALAGNASYEGLPARIEIPPGARQSTFVRELLATDVPRPVFVVMLASRVLSTASVLALLLFLATAFLCRRDLTAGSRTLGARARAGRRRRRRERARSDRTRAGSAAWLSRRLQQPRLRAGHEARAGRAGGRVRIHEAAHHATAGPGAVRGEVAQHVRDRVPDLGERAERVGMVPVLEHRPPAAHHAVQAQRHPPGERAHAVGQRRRVLGLRDGVHVISQDGEVHHPEVGSVANALQCTGDDREGALAAEVPHVLPDPERHVDGSVFVHLQLAPVGNAGLLPARLPTRPVALPSPAERGREVESELWGAKRHVFTTGNLIGPTFAEGSDAERWHRPGADGPDRIPEHGSSDPDRRIRVSTKPERSPVVLLPGAGRAYPMGRISAVFKADGDETAQAYSISEWWLEANTQGPGAHAHPEDDVFYVIEGTMSLRVGERWIDAPAGSFVLIPGGVTHDFENRSDRRAGVLNFSPCVFEPEMDGIAEWFAAHPPGNART